jgi:hypothetical protein
MATRNELALVSTGWGPGCFTAAGATLMQEAYRVETFGLDATTRALVTKQNPQAQHGPRATGWSTDELLATVARVLRSAQTDGNAALVTPSGTLTSTLWPTVVQAAQRIGVHVRYAHGLGIAESLANCLQLPVPPSVEVKKLLSEYVGQAQLPIFALATQVGDIDAVLTLHNGTARLFCVDLYAPRTKVTAIQPQESVPVVADTAFALAICDDQVSARSGLRGIKTADTMESALLWIQVLNGLTESIDG